jgi:hypothetical protein
MATIGSKKDGENVQQYEQSDHYNYHGQSIVHRSVLSGYLGQPTP